MLRTPLCDLVGIDVPVIQSGISVFTSPRLATRHLIARGGVFGSIFR